MITEITILSPLVVLWYLNLLPWYIIIMSIGTIYWFPKWIFLSNGLERFFPEIETRNKNQLDSVAITIDDVIYDNSDSFEQILDILNKYDLKASFFVISSQVTSENQGLLIRAIKEGHELVNHGHTNSQHFAKMTNTLKEEIILCDIVINTLYIEAKINRPIKRFYRPGCGLFHRPMLNLCKKLDHTLVLGSVYPNDTIIRASKWNYWYLQFHVEPGDIIIIHDRQWTPRTLDLLGQSLNKQGIKSITLSNFCSVPQS